MSYVLVETTVQREPPLYFARMTGIGPMTTPHLEEAQRWERADDARRSPACLFPLTFFEPMWVGPTPDGLDLLP